jgi:hypothetical protein
MSGLDPQSKKKGRKRAADMTIHPVDESTEEWLRPPPEDCASSDPYTMPLPCGDPAKYRLKVRMDSLLNGDAMVEFALVLQIHHGGKWRDVVVADSSHSGDIHLHRYGKSADARVGDREVICPVTCLDDVGFGYDLAYEHVVENWFENVGRWHDA